MSYNLQNFQDGKVLHANQLNEIDAKVKEISDAFTSITYTEIEPSSQLTGHYFSDNGDTAGSSASVIYEYADIDFAKNNYYVTCRYGTNTAMYACELQDKNGQVLTRLFLSNGTAKIYERYDITPDITAKGIKWSDIGVIRLSGSTTSGGIMPKLESGIEAISSVSSPTDVYPIYNYGCSIAAFGGSQSTLAQGAGVAQEIWKKYLNYSKIGNFGVGGSGFVRKSSGKKTIPEQVEQAIAEGFPYDVWILQCSTNDWKYGKECGEYTDNPQSIGEITTQCGGINYCIRRIHETYPNARIYLFTSTRFFKTDSSATPGSAEYFELGDSAWNPFSTDGVNGKNLKDFVDAQKKCCMRHNVPVLDLYGCTIYNEYNYTPYFKSDDIHWSPLGYQLHGHLQAEFLLNGR